MKTKLERLNCLSHQLCKQVPAFSQGYGVVVARECLILQSQLHGRVHYLLQGIQFVPGPEELRIIFLFWDKI